MNKYAVIVAAGQGSRMGGSIPKQFLELKGRSVLTHTISAFLSAFNDVKVIIVLPESYLEQWQEILKREFTPGFKLVKGGNTRFQSVKNGLQLVEDNSIVFVHDAVRCLASTDLIRRCFETTIEYGNAIPAVQASDTMRVGTDDNSVMIERNLVHIIQTPQTFFSNLLKKAFEQEYDPSFTDEATVAEKFGIKIRLIKGEDENIKITKPIDLLVAEKILERRGG